MSGGHQWGRRRSRPFGELALDLAQWKCQELSDRTVISL
jgi:hypothetical protein